LKYGTNQGERWYVTFNLVMCYLGMRSLWRAEHTALKLEIESPNRWENKLILGEIYKIQKQYEKAIIYIVDSFEEKRHEADYKPIKRDISHNWNDIGECYFRLNKYTEASQAFRMAAKHNKIDEFKTFLYARAKLMEKNGHSSWKTKIKTKIKISTTYVVLFFYSNVENPKIVNILFFKNLKYFSLLNF